MNRILTVLTILLLGSSVTGVLAQEEHDDDHKQMTEQDTHGHAEADEHDEHGEEHEIDVVNLTDAEMAEFDIVLDTAGPGVIRNEIVVPGEIAVNGNRIAHIVPRFVGVVKKVLKSIGDQVRTGDVLAVVESNEGLTPYNVTALMDGTVIDRQVNVGEVPQGDVPAFIIADLDTVWVNLSIYQMHLSSVRVGQLVTISSGREFADATGRISYLSPIVDEHTRTATARIILPNFKQNWRPGLFVEGRIVTNREKVPLLVPKSALQRVEGNDVIFVKTADGFIPSPVQVGSVDYSSVEIISGLTEGQIYVRKGGFTLKAELETSSLSAGHSH